MTEKQIQNAIIDTVGRLTWLRLWRQNTGRALAPDGTGRVIAFGMKGMADLSGILPDGRRLEIEVKGPKGRLSAEQRNWQLMIQRFGGVYIVARSVDDVLEALREHGYDTVNA